MNGGDELVLRRILDGVDPRLVEADGDHPAVDPLVVVMRPLSAPNPHREVTPCPLLREVRMELP